MSLTSLYTTVYYGLDGYNTGSCYFNKFELTFKPRLNPRSVTIATVNNSRHHDACCEDVMLNSSPSNETTN